MKKQHIFPELLCVSWLMGSDDEVDIVEELYVGLNSSGNLIVALEHYDYDDEGIDNCVYMEVARDETYKLARKLKVPLVKLPDEITDCMSDWCDVRADFAAVRRCFQEIYECLLDEGCHIRIKRRCGKYGYCSW